MTSANDVLAAAHRVLLDVGDDGLAPHTRKDAHALALFIVDLIEDEEMTMLVTTEDVVLKRWRECAGMLEAQKGSDDPLTFEGMKAWWTGRYGGRRKVKP